MKDAEGKLPTEARVVPPWVWKNPKIKPGAMRDTLVELIWHQREKDRCWPKIDKLAKSTGWGQASVRAAIKELQRLGFVEVLQRGGRRGAPSSVYRVIKRPLAADSEPDHEEESRENQRQNLAEVEPETREKHRQNLAQPPPDSGAATARIQRSHRQNLAQPPPESGALEETLKGNDPRKRSKEPDVAHAGPPARAREAPATLTPTAVFRLLDRMWLAARGQALSWKPVIRQDALDVIDQARRTDGAQEPLTPADEVRVLAAIEADMRAFIEATSSEPVSNPWFHFKNSSGLWAERARKGKRPGVGRPAKAGQYPAAPHERFRDGGSADAALQRLGAAFDLEWFDVGGEAPSLHKHRDELEQAFKAFPRELEGEDLEAHFARELENYLAQRPLVVGASPESRAASAAAFCEWFTAARRPVQAMEAAR